MACTLTIPPHLTRDELEHRYRRATDGVKRGHSHILWLLASGMAMAEMARVTRYSVH